MSLSPFGMLAFQVEQLISKVLIVLVLATPLAMTHRNLSHQTCVSVKALYGEFLWKEDCAKCRRSVRTR